MNTTQLSVASDRISKSALAASKAISKFNNEFSVYDHLRRAADLEAEGDYRGMIHEIDAALAIDSENHDAKFALGMALFNTHRVSADHPYGAAWNFYEHRPSRIELLDKMDEYPEWQGEPLKGQTILVCREQGIGDQIQMVRYVPKLVELGATVILHCHKDLGRLFAALVPEAEIITDSRDIDAEGVNYWIGICSLPLHFGVIAPIENVPKFIPACHFVDTGALKVGLCWAGNPQHRRDEFRSMRFQDLEPVLSVPNCDFYSLQVGDAARQNDGNALDVMPWCMDFYDTASILQQLDVVVTVDTAVAHLAGTLGVKQILMQGKCPDPRWEYPWYQHVGRIKGILDPATIAAQMLDQGWPDRKRDASAYRMLAHEEQACVTVDTVHGPMVMLRTGRYVARGLREYGEWSDGEIDLMRAYIAPGEVVIDAGANVGAHTLALSKIVGPSGHVHAFEPDLISMRMLLENVHDQFAAYVVKRSPDRELASRNVTLHRAALGSVDHHITLAWENGNNPEVMSRVADDGDTPCIRLDRLKLERVDFIKADIEGMEYEMLCGAEETIARCRPLLYIEDDKEWQTDALLGWLLDHDYRIYQHRPRLWRANNYRGNQVNVFGNIVSGMLFCVPQERKRFPLYDNLELSRVRVKKVPKVQHQVDPIQPSKNEPVGAHPVFAL